MRFSLHKISLRACLLVLTALALAALLIAMLSAYRTARMSAAFAEQRIENDVRAAARELSLSAENPFDKSPGADKKGNLPPPVREILRRYADSDSRTTAIALERFAEVSGGLCAANGDVRGFVGGRDASNNFSNLSVREICAESISTDDFRAQTTQSNGETFYTVFAPVAAANDTSLTEIRGVFALQKLPSSDILSDEFNLATQGFLLILVVALVLLSFVTLRRWRAGMDGIESGLRNISDDLSNRIEPPKITELARVGGEINRLAENLEANLKRRGELEKDLAHSEKLAALGRVASGAAHEIRNPLAAMKLKIQLAERGDFDKTKLEKTFAVLNEEIGRLDRVVTRMLDAGKAEKLTLSIIAPVEIMRGRIDLINESAARQAVKIETNLGAENLKIEFDGEKLTQVFDNLLLNALEAMPDGGVLKVESFADGNKLAFKISDTGAGISAADQDRIFEPFYTTKDKGTGLGLAISREIIEAHGGNLKFFVTETETVFVLELRQNHLK